MPPTVTEIEQIEFTFPIENLAINRSRRGFPYEYEPGSVLDRHFHALKIHTDTDVTGEFVGRRGGLSGFGEYLIGKNPLKRERHNTERAGNVDIAIWDLAGKYYDAPIHEMLGGSRMQLPAYASAPTGDEEGGLDSPEAMADFAEQCLELGYPAFKHHSWMISDRHLDRGPAVDREVEALRAIRERVGDEMDLMLDGTSQFDTFRDALTVGRACDKYDYYWYEDPIDNGVESLQSSRKLRQMIETPLLQTEAVRGLQPKTEFLVNEATDFLRVSNLENDGGITGAMKAAHVAEGFGLDLEYNSPGPAQRHCMAATPHSNYYELGLVHPEWSNIHYPPVYENGYSDELTAINDDGTVPVPNDPGLGVEYNWSFINDNKVSERKFS